MRTSRGHYELLRVAREIVNGTASDRQARYYAGEAPFLKGEGEDRERAHLHNALRNLVLSWGLADGGAHVDCLVAAIGHTLSAFDLLPARAAAPARRVACPRDVPVPWYVQKDLEQ